ncbi:MAG: adenosine deaminase [Chloroflexi bacterium]|nr:adenosine deaminase [Chloroflexota bacterium]
MSAIGIDAFIRGLPKAELHVHLEGTLEPEMRVRLAGRNGVDLPYRTADELAASYEYRDLQSFLALYFSGMDVLLTEQDFFDLTYAYLRRVRAQNVVYTEMHFDPQAHTSRGIAFDTVISGIRRAQEAAQDTLGIRSQLILGFLRDMSVESAMETLTDSLPYKDWIIGVGLDSDEKDNPPVKFREVFERARAEGYMLTMHCDHLQENSVEHIRQCLDVIGVDRIDHGYHALDDAGLIAEARRQQVCLTFCTTATPTNPTPRRAAELKRALELGLNVTANTDDPAYMRSYYMSEVLANTQQAVGLTRGQVAQLARNAFRSAWVGEDERDGYLAAVDGYAGSSSPASTISSI